MTENQLTHPMTHLFSEKGLPVRAVWIDGEVWFVAKDVCHILALRTNNLRVILDDDEICDFNPNDYTVFAEAGRGGKAMLAINEPVVYSLIVKSRKPEAIKFKRWITHEVLPSIRKTGRYGAATLQEATESPRTVWEQLEIISQQLYAEEQAAFKRRDS